jgi:uncharacterized protein (TIGR03435 family)
MWTSPVRTESRELLAVGIFGCKSRLGDRIEILLRRGRTFSPRASAAGVAASAIALSGLMLAGSLAPRWIAFAQAMPRPSFEVASVKPGNPSNPRVSYSVDPGGRFIAINITLRTLIGFAHGVRSMGGPSWLDSQKYDIEAKPDAAFARNPDPANSAQLRLMLQSLLEERFRLTLHRETREEHVYTLAKAKGGIKLVEPADAEVKDDKRGIMAAPGGVRGVAAPMSNLTGLLSQQLRRLVIDRTGLTGKYDFELRWTPDTAHHAESNNDAPSDGPSLFTAVQEQLGLELESAKAPVEFLVIDHVEKPDAN